MYDCATQTQERLVLIIVVGTNKSK